MRHIRTLALTYVDTAIKDGVKPVFKEVSLDGKRSSPHQVLISLLLPEPSRINRNPYLRRAIHLFVLTSDRFDPVADILFTAYFLATTFSRLENPSNPLEFVFEKGFSTHDLLWEPHKRETVRLASSSEVNMCRLAHVSFRF